MNRINLDPLITFSDGSHRVISTQCLRDRGFFCALYSAVIAANDRRRSIITANSKTSETHSTFALHSMDVGYGHQREEYVSSLSFREPVGSVPPMFHSDLSLIE
jgi:hypothetical protein